MKEKTIKLKIYHNALVDTIQYLDRINHSDTHLQARQGQRNVALEPQESLNRKVNEDDKQNMKTK